MQVGDKLHFFFIIAIALFECKKNLLQVTNYGLGGLCEQHIDPHGYLEGMHLPRSRESLKFTGDMIGTFMAWLTDVGAGGGTSYIAPGKILIF